MFPAALVHAWSAAGRRGRAGPRLAHDVADLAGRHAAPAGAHALQDAADLGALQVAVAADVRLRARACGSIGQTTAYRTP
jgi:hypothetical protein